MSDVKVDPAEVEKLREELLWCSLWKTQWHELPGPRDWSPRVKRGEMSLEAFRDLVPKSMLMSMERAVESIATFADVENSGLELLIRMVRSGMGFIVQIGDRLEAVFVSQRGQVIMSEQMRKIFNILFKAGRE